MSNVNVVSYARRMLDFKGTVGKFKTLSPKSLVVIRTPTQIRGNLKQTYGIINGFQQARLREVQLRILGNDENIVIFDAWWPTETLFDLMEIGNVHPTPILRKAHLRFLADLMQYEFNKL